MPRIQRIKEEFSTYHIVQRGNEKKNIFRKDKDKLKFLEILAKAKAKYKFLFYAYCLMDNHVHLLINDNGSDISQLMKSINVSYVSYFNRVYERSGHLFQDRFRSELVKNDSYLLEVSRYIHNNPVKAKLVKRPGEFKWSSYNIYSQKKNDEFDLIDTDMILNYFGGPKPGSIIGYKKFVARYEPTVGSKILDIGEEHQEPEEDYSYQFLEAQSRLANLLAAEKITLEELLGRKSKRNEMICILHRNYALNLKELGELFGGLSESQISRVVSRKK